MSDEFRRRAEYDQEQLDAIPEGYVRRFGHEKIQDGDLTWRIGSRLYLRAESVYVGRRVDDWGHFVIYKPDAKTEQGD